MKLEMNYPHLPSLDADALRKLFSEHKDPLVKDLLSHALNMRAATQLNEELVKKLETKHDELRQKVMTIAVHLETVATHEAQQARFEEGRLRDHREADVKFLRGEANLLLKAAEGLE